MQCEIAPLPATHTHTTGLLLGSPHNHSLVTQCKMQCKTVTTHTAQAVTLFTAQVALVTADFRCPGNSVFKCLCSSHGMGGTTHQRLGHWRSWSRTCGPSQPPCLLSDTPHTCATNQITIIHFLLTPHTCATNQITIIPFVLTHHTPVQSNHHHSFSADRQTWCGYEKKTSDKSWPKYHESKTSTYYSFKFISL